jgi:uncharacterized protein YecT (DUF1311 family)
MTLDADRPERGLDPSAPVLTDAEPRLGGRDTQRMLLIGIAVAVVLGALFALLMRPNLNVGRDQRPAAAQEEEASAAERFDIKQTREEYRAPDRDAVAQAYAKAGEVYQAEGVSGLARYGLQCFRVLEERSSYRQLDYCIAFDAFAAAMNQRVAGGQPAPPDSYFGQTAERHMAVAEAVMGPEGDASARLTDLRRIAIEVARLSGPAVLAAPGAGVPAQPPLAAAPQAAPAGAAAPAAQIPAAQIPAAQIPAAEPGRFPAVGGPTAREVAAARPARGQGPSFNCRYARTNAERMVCGNADLAAADRRLNDAFENAIAAGADREALRLEQDRWLAQREGAAPDPEAVREAYERRTRELESLEAPDEEE